MSYKRNSKSRIARLLLALTLMGGVGQRITNNVSHAMDPRTISSFSNNMGGKFQASNGNWGSFEELDINGLENPVDQHGDLTENAKLFAKLVSCELEVENGKINAETGEVTRQGVYNVDALKSAVSGVFSNMNNDECFWPRYIKSYGVISGFDFYAVAKLLLAGASPVGFKFSTTQKQDVYNIFSTNKGFMTPFAEVESNSLALQNFINGLTDPGSENYSSVMMIGRDGSVVVKKGEDLGTSELEGFDGVPLYSTAEVAIDFGEVSLAENEFNSIKGTIDSFSPTERGNFKRFNGIDFKIKISGSEHVKGFATLMAINKYLELEGDDVGEAVLEASTMYRSIVKSSICQKTREEFQKDYDTVAGINKDKFPVGKKDGAVNFVLLVQHFYNAIGGLKPEFTIDDFAGALKADDSLMKLIQMICKAFQGQDLTDFTSGMADNTCKEFLKYELGGDVIGKQGQGKQVQGKQVQGKQGQGEQGQDEQGQGSDKPGEKKGLSTGAKVAMGITIPAAVLAAAVVALWKTGYGATIINKVKDLMKGNKGTRPDIKFNGQGNKPVVKN